MAAPRLVVELTIGDEDATKPMAIARSRTDPASRVERARILLAYLDDPSFFAVGRSLGAHHRTVQRCVERAAGRGALAALDDSPRPGKKPVIAAEAKEWLVALACRKAKDLLYPRELWTARLLPAMRASMDLWPAMPAMPAWPVWFRAPYARSSTRARRSRARCVAISSGAIPNSKKKWRTSCAFAKTILKEAAAAAKEASAVAIVSYGEKPGVQAIGTAAPDLPPKPGVHAAFSRLDLQTRQGSLIRFKLRKR